MLISEAQVKTGRPSRYLTQLCKHFSNRGRHLPRHGVQEHLPAVEDIHVEWSDTEGRVDFGWGQCVLLVAADGLTMRVQAADEESLRRVQEVLTVHIERFGKRDNLTVNWPAAGETTDAAHSRVKRHAGRTTTLALVGAVAVIVVLHLALGSAALASPWAGALTIVVLAGVLVKIAFVGLMLARRRRRSARTPKD